ncbi:hypothetical protein QBC38DRAFT_114392 [Podospora fimiseda]|uniref:Flavin-nucleotide-binding protein n=1 Tax=Podospora fimiseda TaxID=252190 RepID=A0AAN7BTU2_9PEZI|nr:hypothetical protein QBC38DRAFT_114392 [Podospora fimiseda]
MPRQELEYPKEPNNTVKRYPEKGKALIIPPFSPHSLTKLPSTAKYELETIHRIINSSQIVHVAFNAPNGEGFPSILPMIGQMGSYSRPSADLGDPLDLYLHGYVSSRIISLGRSSSSSESSEGLPVSISAAFVDGLVLSLTPNSHSYNFRSAVIFGNATLVTDPQEKLYAMELVTNGVAPQRWQKSRTPPSPGEMASTSILRVKIKNGSAKVRTGGPSDAKEDMEDLEMRSKVWAGVIPVYQTLGEAIPAEYNLAGDKVPDYLEEWRKEENEDAKVYAKDVGARPYVKVKKSAEEDE